MFAALSYGAFVIAEQLTIQLLRRAVAIDVRGQCSSYTNPTPRGGGALVAVGLLVATALIHNTASALFLLAIAGFNAIGLAEDLRGFPRPLSPGTAGHGERPGHPLPEGLPGRFRLGPGAWPRLRQGAALQRIRTWPNRFSRSR